MADYAQGGYSSEALAFRNEEPMEAKEASSAFASLAELELEGPEEPGAEKPKEPKESIELAYALGQAI